MTDDEGSQPDELLHPDDEELDEWVRSRREKRFTHRELREAKAIVRAAEHHDVPGVREGTVEAWHMAKKELLARESFAPVFFLTVLVIIFTPLVETSRFGRLIVLVGIVGALLLALQRSLLHRRTFIRLVWVLGIAVILAAVSMALLDRGHDPWRASAVVAAIYVAVIIVALPALLIRTLLHPRITLNTLAGVMTAYLFLGLMFTGVFRFIDAVDEGSFFAEQESVAPGDFEYFSFITITTTGYGDLTPANQAARTAAMAEAIAGQVFLVTVVARVVANFGQSRTVTLPIDQVVAGGGPPDEDPNPEPNPEPS